MKRYGLTLAIASTLVLAAATAGANDLDIRCNNDALDPAQARARLEWARNCGLKVNVGDRFPSGANAWKRMDTFIPSAAGSTGGTLIEFFEADADGSLGGTPNFWSQNTYTSVSVGYQINDTYTSKQWLNWGTTQSLASNPIDGKLYEKWTRPAIKLLARPMYPTFGSQSTPGAGIPLYPHEHITPNDCSIFTARNGGTAQANFFVNGYCTSSCYTPEQRVLMADGEMQIVEALKERTPEMMTLTPTSNLDEIALQTNTVGSYTTELWDTDHVIYEITTSSGGQLRVTDEHPILRGDGVIVQAKTLHHGDDLIKTDGSLDEIKQVKVTHHFGKVYNIKPATQDRVSNLLVAQGYIVGSSRYQNEDVDYINRVILFRAIPANVLPQ